MSDTRPTDDHRSRVRQLMPSPALVVAGLALVVALTGTGYAAGLISGKSIRNGTIGGSKLANKTVTGAKIANHTITASKLARGVLKQYRFVLTPAAESFYFSDPADRIYFSWDNAPHAPALHQQGLTIHGFASPVVGAYCVTVSGAITPPIATVTPDYQYDTTGQFDLTQVELNSNRTNCPGATFEVDTFHVSAVYSVVANAARRPATFAFTKKRP